MNWGRFFNIFGLSTCATLQSALAVSNDRNGEPVWTLVFVATTLVMILVTARAGSRATPVTVTVRERKEP